MRRTISAFTTVAAAAILAVVTIFLPNLPTFTGPLVVSLLVVVFSLAWPVTVNAKPRWSVSAGLAVPGLLAVWLVSLLPLGTRFSERALELWLAPVGGAIALGVLLMFVIQTFTLPGGVKRSLATAMFAVGAVISGVAAGWALLLRNKYEVAAGAYGVERITGVTWLMLTVLAALAVAALVTLVPTRRRNRMILTIVGATAVAVALQFFRPGPLSVPAVIASAITALMVALVDSFSDSPEAPQAALGHPLTAVAVGSARAIVPGMVSYFVIHALPW
ncbi:hypothetical protein GCM10023190_10980 [Enteractinococcus fodinae]|uniref:Membrane protein n=1 Tax=Enteractinococcus fodinae TaxID=684663 RepID=A0ABU2AYJ4_9MICC|nr:hypothetical protein [Enteractinococcus fodinae]MDR7346423.1 putative membrane protein [Enteractinococcus fodinae]